MWYNANPSHIVETTAFTPLPPHTPKYSAPVNGSAVSGTSVTLKWYGGPWAHNYDIYFGTSPTPPRVAANVNLGPSATTSTFQKFVASNLAPGTTYYWKVVSKTMANVTASGAVWSFTTGPASGAAVPLPWHSADVGAVGVAGGATFSGGTFSVAGAGADVWGTADAFHFVYKTLLGDGELIARVGSIQHVDDWSKAGLMVRASLAPNAAYAFMLASASKGMAFQYRKAAGASATNVAGVRSVPPMWVKITRVGNIVTGYESANGSTWHRLASVPLALGATVQIGFAVTSHDSTQRALAAFTVG
jgi:hypothetical protein